MTEFFDNIVQSDTNPQSATDGWGTLDENEGRYWLNTTTNIKYYHNGTSWINFDSADGMSVSRNSLCLTCSGFNSLTLENVDGVFKINGEEISRNRIFTIDTLPSTLNNGSLALVTDGGAGAGDNQNNNVCLAYYYDNIWYRVLDNHPIKNFQSDPEGSWITQNGEKFFIDRYNRMYKLLLRQDITKDVDGNPQANAGWPNDDPMITSTHRLNHNNPETATQFLNFDINWDDYKDENGKLEFKKEWPGIEVRYPYDASRLVNFIDQNNVVTDWMTWRQSQVPLVNGTLVNGIAEDIDEGNNISFYNRQGGTNSQFDFDGLVFDSQNNTYTDGNMTGGWFYAAGVLGTIPNFAPGRFIPIMFLGGDANNANNWISGEKVNLWLRVPTRVYLTAGQSNAVGYGEQSELPHGLTDGVPIENVQYWNRNTSQWSSMTPGSTDASVYFGYELPLGYHISQDNGSTGTPSILNKYVIKYASGGTNLHTQWNPNGNNNTQWQLWVQTVTAALSTFTKPYQVVGMAWMQGESDANSLTNANNYETNLTNLITHMRNIVGFPKMYFAIGKIFMPNANDPNNVIIVRTAQQSVADNDEYAFTIETNDFTGGTSANVGLRDGIHYNGSSLTIMAERFWNIFQNNAQANEPTPVVPNFQYQNDTNFNIVWQKLLSQDLFKDVNTNADLTSGVSWSNTLIQQNSLNIDKSEYANYFNFNVNYIRNVNNNLVLKIEWGDLEQNWEYIEQIPIPNLARVGSNVDIEGFVPIRINSIAAQRNRGIAISLNSNNTWLDTDSRTDTWWGSLGFVRNSLFSGGMPAVYNVTPADITPSRGSDLFGSHLIPKKASIWMAIEGIATASNKPKISLLEYDVSGNWWRKMLSQDITKDYNTNNTIATQQYWNPIMCAKHMWNESNPWMANYINFNIDYDFHKITNTDTYQFKLYYPDTDDYIIFLQKNKPLEAIDSYQIVNSNHAFTGFEGIAPEPRYNAWLSGTITHIEYWRYGLGIFYPHTSAGNTGIPGTVDTANTNSFWIKTPISSSNDIFNIDGTTVSWHSLLDLTVAPPAVTIGGLQLLYTLTKKVYFDSDLTVNTQIASYMSLIKPSGGTSQGIFSFSIIYFDTSHKNQDLKFDIINKTINFVIIVELVQALGTNMSVECSIEEHQGSVTVKDTTSISNTFPVGIYELKAVSAIPGTATSGTEYRFNIKLNGDMHDSEYVRIRGLRIENIS